nr:hypothetical protein [Candidatus Freyrarchaeum guaymaensis]
MVDCEGVWHMVEEEAGGARAKGSLKRVGEEGMPSSISYRAFHADFCPEQFCRLPAWQLVCFSSRMQLSPPP